MSVSFYLQLEDHLDQVHVDGLFKKERILTTPQQAEVSVAGGHSVINFCSNHYLGLANYTELIRAAKAGLDSHGLGVVSVRFIYGTLHTKSSNIVWLISWHR